SRICTADGSLLDAAHEQHAPPSSRKVANELYLPRSSGSRSSNRPRRVGLPPHGTPTLGAPMHLCREHQTWTFRRRVPRQLQERLGQAEVYRSLATTCKREARKLAAVLYAATEELFALAEDETITNDDLRTAAR